MTAKKKFSVEEQKHTQLLEELCEHTMAIRRVVNRILDHLHECCTPTCDNDEGEDLYPDPDELSLDDIDNGDDMYF